MCWISHLGEREIDIKFLTWIFFLNFERYRRMMQCYFLIEMVQVAKLSEESFYWNLFCQVVTGGKLVVDVKSTTKRQNELLGEVWKLFSLSSTDVPALLPCARLPRQARGTQERTAYKPSRTVHFVSWYTTVQIPLSILLYVVHDGHTRLILMEKDSFFIAWVRLEINRNDIGRNQKRGYRKQKVSTESCNWQKYLPFCRKRLASAERGRLYIMSNLPKVATWRSRGFRIGPLIAEKSTTLLGLTWCITRHDSQIIDPRLSGLL